MTTYVFRDGKLVKKLPELSLVRSDLSAPMVVSDNADPFFSHADGRTYDSKSQYYRTLKEKGLRIVEPGEPLEHQDQWSKPVIEDVTEAYKKVRDGYKPAPLDKEEIDG